MASPGGYLDGAGTPSAVLTYGLQKTDLSCLDLTAGGHLIAPGIQVDDTLLKLLCCPTCRGDLVVEANALRCATASCAKSFTVVSGRPILIDHDRSVFSRSEYAETCDRGEPSPPTSLDKLRTWTRQLPAPSVNLSAHHCFEIMGRRLSALADDSVVLVVGGGIQGKGLRTLMAVPSIRLINIDPSQLSAAVVLCDGHDLPFRDGAVDGVVVQAVLEHVADPWRCVEEIHRVLKPEGIVYSEIPFMQQVHMQGYDFTRFTHIGHRRLFRRFAELESGAVAGPGTALAWSWRYFLSSFTRSRRLGALLRGIGRVTGFFLEMTDHLLKHRPAALDGASCTYFLGTKSDASVCDKDVLAGYRGAQRRGAPATAQSAVVPSRSSKPT